MQHSRLVRWSSGFTVACALLVCAATGRSDDEANALGKKIYTENCAYCHGGQGEGTKKHKQALIGDRSVAQLAEVIAETMPEDDPGSLKPSEASAVAAFIHDAFYSKVARERNRPARVELARLTVRQYRQTMTDLIGSFRDPVAYNDAEHGLSAEYSKGKRRNAMSAVKRIDPKVEFDFGTGTPVPEITDPLEFTIRWTGSVVAPETGEYQFTVRSEHAARLWINDPNTALIDAAVRSGKDDEHSGTIQLIAGRRYGLRLEFTKAQQIADANNKRNDIVPVKASILLSWKRPQGLVEPIPPRYLSPQSLPENFTSTTPFPPDDRSYGWERGTFVSKEWDQATTDAALEAVAGMAGRLPALAGYSESDPADKKAEKLRAFCKMFAERAFRKPLTPELAQLVIEEQFGSVSDPELAAKRTLVLILKSPRFLYREVTGGTDGQDVAARLSYGLWDSIPDKELRRAAEAGELTTKEQIAKQAERMLADPKAKNKLREFFLAWLKADTLPDLAKDAERFPGFDAGTVADLRTSLEMLLDDVIWSEGSDYRRLFTTDQVYLNERLGKLYGVEAPAGGEFVKTALDPEQRAGILTHPYLLSNFAYTSDSSPIHRGVFLMRGVLGQALKPPPEAVTPFTADLHPSLTTRERVSLQTEATSCSICHGIINPLGFTLEHFDAIGRYREKDREKPVDATGTYRTRKGDSVAINGAKELAAFLVGSEEAHAAFTEQLFHHLVQQPMRAYGESTLDDLRQSFEKHDYDIRKLIVEIMVASSLAGRQDAVVQASEKTAADAETTTGDTTGPDGEDAEVPNP